MRRFVFDATHLSKLSTVNDFETAKSRHGFVAAFKNENGKTYVANFVIC